MSDIRAALENVGELQADAEKVKELQLELERAKQFENALKAQRAEDHHELEKEKKRREELEVAQEEQRREYERDLHKIQGQMRGVVSELDQTKAELMKASDMRTLLEEQIKQKELEVAAIQAGSEEELNARLAELDARVMDAIEKKAAVEKAHVEQRDKLDQAQKDLRLRQSDLHLKDKETHLLQNQIKAMEDEDKELQKKFAEQVEQCRKVQLEADANMKLARERELEISEKESKIIELENKLQDRVSQLNM
eukprot:191025_1